MASKVNKLEEFVEMLSEVDGVFDWKVKGKELYHFVEPTTIGKEEVENFKEVLPYIAKRKLTQATDRFSLLTSLEKKAIKKIKFMNKTDSQIAIRLLAEFLIEKTYIQKWERYWVSLIIACKVLWIPSNGDAPTHVGRISEDDVRRAKEYPIEQLYGAGLRQVGRTLTGLCPFHKEKSPSFTIYTDKNSYYCFGCLKSGDSIDFYMSKNDKDFIETVKSLK